MWEGYLLTKCGKLKLTLTSGSARLKRNTIDEFFSNHFWGGGGRAHPAGLYVHNLAGY